MFFSLYKYLADRNYFKRDEADDTSEETTEETTNEFIFSIPDVKEFYENSKVLSYDDKRIRKHALALLDDETSKEESEEVNKDDNESQDSTDDEASKFYEHSTILSNEEKKVRAHALDVLHK